jgi:hypothetical protein
VCLAILEARLRTAHSPDHVRASIGRCISLRKWAKMLPLPPERRVKETAWAGQFTLPINAS